MQEERFHVKLIIKKNIPVKNANNVSSCNYILPVCI